MKKKTNNIVLVFGTFDIFHEGHINFLKQAQKQGDYLVVVVARDKTVFEIKKQNTLNSEKNRKIEIEKSKLADEVILGGLKNKYAVIKKYKPDIICLGYDQKAFVSDLKAKIKEFGLKTKIIRLKAYYPKKYKSSLLRNKNGN